MGLTATAGLINRAPAEKIRQIKTLSTTSTAMIWEKCFASNGLSNDDAMNAEGGQ